MSDAAPTWPVRVVAPVLIGGLAFGLDSWLGDGGSSILTAVIAAATVAYCWFTYDLVRAAETQRRDRLAAETEEERRLLERFLVEVKQNLHRQGQTHVWHAHVPFEMTAFNEARHLFQRMPPEVWTHVAEIGSRSARYNTVAAYHNSKVNPGSGMGDDAVTRVAVEAHETQANAIPILEEWVAGQFPL